ncbi:MAG: M20 family metallopeptidase [Ruminococcaceae bacterium]|nr:M20 family metallopeptidase [Oscillospiraceae bacterium]
MITPQDIIRQVERNRDEVLRCLVEALRAPSPTGSELPMARVVGRWLDTLGIDVDTRVYMADRPNYIARWQGSRPGKTFLFNGHMDVFPATESDDPDYDPWSGEIRDGCVYGRGASDMKSGDCAALMAVKLLKDMGFDPKGTVVLNYVSDEESGGQYGILSLLEEDLIHADFGISMEPSSPDEHTTDMLVGHGGVYPCRVTVYGDGGHAAKDISPDDPDNRYGGEDAIAKGMKAVAALQALAREVNARPADDLGKAHLAVTKFHAGTAVNNYPRRAEICVDRRYITGESPASVDAEIIAALEAVKAEDPAFAYSFQGPCEPDTPIYRVDESSPVVAAIDESCRELLGRTPRHFTKIGGCDVAYIKRAVGGDYPWFGPGTSRIACADERVSIENYLNCIKVYMYTLVKLMS